MVDAVLSYHTNPQTCGVAKFNQLLAQKLGVPFAPLTHLGRYAHPLVSIKGSEIGPWMWPQGNFPYDLFAHDAALREWVHGATTIYAGNAEIARELRQTRPDVIEAFCPSTVQGDPTRGAYRVLVFGMANKLAIEYFKDLKIRLDAEHPDYTVSLSTAVHEGSPWDTTITDAIDAMRGVFGDKLRVLGFLADDALAKELQECDAVAAFFVPALRANNTSAWAAIWAGKRLFTNIDHDSPNWMDPSSYSWDALLQLMGAQVPV